MILANIKDYPELKQNYTYRCPPVIGGVYFLFSKHGEVLYVGQSQDLYRRINDHRKDLSIRYWYFSFIQIDDKNKREMAETRYIHKMKPKHNYRQNPVWIALERAAVEVLKSRGEDAPKRKLSKEKVEKILKLNQ